MAAPTKLEFSVKMTCQSCIDAVKSSLRGQEDVKLTGIDISTQQVLVETSLPSARVQELIETSGRQAVLMGVGSTSNAPHLGAAVAMLAGGSVQGVVRMLQADESTCVVDGTIDGLRPGPHRVAIHEYGDLSDGCQSCGNIFDPFDSNSFTQERLGDLGCVDATDDGRAQFRMTNTRLKVWDVIGRSMVVHNTDSVPTDNTGIAWGIIARSSGLFENTKRICACDGVSIWDEKNVPIAGPGRQQAPASQL